MHLGGGVVAIEQSQLIQEVVTCKSWKWTSYVLAAVQTTELGSCATIFFPDNIRRARSWKEYETNEQKTRREQNSDFDVKRCGPVAWSAR